MEGQAQVEAGTAAPAPVETTATKLDAAKAEIKARIKAAATPPAETAPAATTTETPAATPTATPAPAKAEDSALSELKAQVAALTARLTETPKPKEEPAPDKYAALLERIKQDPAAVFDEFPELLTIEKVSEAALRRQDNPAHKELSAHEREIADLKKRIDDKEKSDRERDERSQAEQGAAAAHAVAKTLVEAEKGRWPRVSRAEENIAEAIREAGAAGRKVVDELRKNKGEKWLPTEDEATAIFKDCMDGVEKDFAARATRYGAPDITPKPTTAAPAPARKTIPAAGTTPGAARSADTPVVRKDLATRKGEILSTVRRNARQPA